jgi:HEXXH motif-containing protein
VNADLSSHWARQFACPFESTDERIFETIAVQQARALASWLVSSESQKRATLNGSDESLPAYIASWAESSEPTTFDLVWSLPFGRLQLAMKGGNLNFIDLAVRVAMRITEGGHRGNWRATGPQLRGLRLGPYLLPDTKQIEVEQTAAGVRVRIQTVDDAELEGRRAADAHSWKLSGAKRLRTIGGRNPIFLLPNGPLSAAPNDSQGFEGVTPWPTIDNKMVAVFRDGLGVIISHAEAYRLWVERVLHGIVASKVEDSLRVESGSGENAPGTIHVSYPIGRMDIAEILVHECAHQYFYLLERVGDLEDGTDKKLYWSPPIRRHRPLSRILMAYHALANVLLFYESCEASHADDGGYVRSNRKDMERAVAELDAPLQGNRALTSLGRCLYEPLAERIGALRSRSLITQVNRSKQIVAD